MVRLLSSDTQCAPAEYLEELEESHGGGTAVVSRVENTNQGVDLGEIEAVNTLAVTAESEEVGHGYVTKQLLILYRDIEQLLKVAKSASWR